MYKRIFILMVAIVMLSAIAQAADWDRFIYQLMQSTNDIVNIKDQHGHFLEINPDGSIEVSSDVFTIARLNQLIILVSTSSTYSDSLRIKQYVLISTGTDRTVSRQDFTITLISTHSIYTQSWLDKIFQQQSTSTVKITDWQDKTFQLTSTGTDITIARLDAIRNEIYGIAKSTDMAEIVSKLYGLSRSTDIAQLMERNSSIARSTDIAKLNSDINVGLYAIAQSTDITRLINELYGISRSTDIARLFLELYGVARSTGQEEIITKLNSMLAQLNTISITSGTIFTEALKGTASTGTVLTVADDATVSYTPAANCKEIFIDAPDENTNPVRFRFYNENVNTAGIPIYASTGRVLDTWKTAIYFQSESGNQLIIVNEVD